MNANEMRLKDAGFRERRFVELLDRDNKLPPGVDLQGFLDHGLYDARLDEVFVNVKGVRFAFRVVTP